LFHATEELCKSYIYDVLTTHLIFYFFRRTVKRDRISRSDIFGRISKDAGLCCFKVLPHKLLRAKR